MPKKGGIVFDEDSYKHDSIGVENKSSTAAVTPVLSSPMGRT